MDFLIEFWKNPQYVLIAVVCFALSIIGVIPIGTPHVLLDNSQRILFLALGMAIGALPPLFSLRQRQVDATPSQQTVNLLATENDQAAVSTPQSLPKEYEQRLVQQQQEDAIVEKEIAELPESSKIISFQDMGQVRFTLINDNILNARTDILVSSDDNYLQAKGGVAKALINKAGTNLTAELTHYRTYAKTMRQGDIAITTGGLTGAKAIFHPAVIDLDHNRWPDEKTIRKVVRQSLICATAMGAESIAFPVIGGGTGAVKLEPWDNINFIVSEVINFLFEGHNLNESSLKYIALYVFDRNDIKDLEIIQKLIPDQKDDSGKDKSNG